MNFKTTLVLVVLLAAVALYFVFVERDRPATRHRQPAPEADGTLVLHQTPLAIDQVTRIVIQRDGERVVIERADGAWRQVEPVTFPLRDFSVRQMLNAAADLRYMELIAPGDAGLTLADAGLEPPRVTVTIEQGEHAASLRLGRRAPGGHGYLMLDDHPEIHLVDDALHDRLLDQHVRDWRRRDLDTPAAAATQRIVLEDGDRTIELIKHEGRWYLDEQLTQRASRDAVESLTDALADVRIEAFTADQPDDLRLFGLHAPRFRLTLHTPEVDDDQATQAHTLRLGSGTDLEASEHFATWSVGEAHSPVVFTLRQRHVDALRREIDELRDPHPLTTAPREVNAIEIERTGQPTLHLVRRTDRGFDFGEPAPDYAVDYDAASDLLDQLAELEAEAFDPEFEPTDEPVAVVRITPRGSGAVETLRVYATDDPEQHKTLRVGESVAYVLKREQIEALFKPRVAFRSRDVLELDEQDMTQLTLEREDGVTFTFTRGGEDDAWSLADHETFDAEALETLIGRLAPLRVEGWVLEADEAPAGDAAWAVLTVELADASPRVLRVDPESRLGMIDGVEPMFTAPRALVRALTAEYRDRVVLDVRREAIEAVTLGWDDDAVTLRRDEEDHFVADDNRSVNQGAAGRLFDTLAGLRVERYEAIEPSELPKPARRLTVRVADEIVHELALIVPEDEDSAWQRFAIVDDRVVRLRQRDFDRLEAEVTGAPREADDTGQMVK